MQIIKFKPQVVILDVRMPGLDGVQVCRDIKNNPDTRDIRILAVTGKAEGEEVEEILRCGVEHCLLKPFKVDELKRYVQTFASSVNERKES
jgi:CheY-like chemotaxis protein